MKETPRTNFAAYEKHKLQDINCDIVSERDGARWSNLLNEARNMERELKDANDRLSSILSPDAPTGSDSDKVKEAFEVIKQAMIDDDPNECGGYAHSWHCNISMMCQDAIASDNENRQPMFQVSNSVARKIGNDTASRFMNLCFDVDMQNF